MDLVEATQLCRAPQSKRAPPLWSLDVPEWLLLRVLSRVDFSSFLNCELTCRTIFDLCKQSTRLLFIKESLRLGQTPLNPEAGSAYELLDSLRARESAWKNLSLPSVPSSVYHIPPFEETRGHGHVVSGNILYFVAYRRSTTLPVIVSRLDLSTGLLVSPWISQMAETVISATIAVDEMGDRIVLGVAHKPEHSGSTQSRLLVFTYSFSGELKGSETVHIDMHQLLRLSLEKTSTCVWYSRPNRTNMRGSTAILRRRHAGTPSEIRILDGSGIMFTDEIFIQSDGTSGSLNFIDVWDASGSPKCLRTLMLPDLGLNWKYEYAGLTNTTPLHVTATARLHCPVVSITFDVHIDGGVPHSNARWHLLVERESLVKLLDQRSPSFGDSSSISWSTWSELVRTSLLGPFNRWTLVLPPVGNHLVQMTRGTDPSLLTLHEVFRSAAEEPLDRPAVLADNSNAVYPFIYAQTADLLVRARSVSLPWDDVDVGGGYHLSVDHLIHVVNDKVLVWRVS